MRRRSRAPLPGWPISRREHWLLHTRLWLAALAPATDAIVRFEDAKADPRATLKGVLAALDVRAGDAEIAAALDASDHAAAKAAERRLLDAGIVPSPLLGEGTPNGHRRRSDAAPLLDARFAGVCAALGYDAPAPAEPPAPHPRDAVVARLMQRLLPATAPLRLEAWLRAACEDLGDVPLR